MSDCIPFEYEREKSVSWCGKEQYNYRYLHIDEAAFAGRQKGNLKICHLCLAEITKALFSGMDIE